MNEQTEIKKTIELPKPSDKLIKQTISYDGKRVGYVYLPVAEWAKLLRRYG